MASKQTRDQFISKAIEAHGQSYGYNSVVYAGAHKRVAITCPVHGDFLQTPVQHISQRQGCPHCAGTARLTTDLFIMKAAQIHGELYDYSKVDYVSNDVKVSITCHQHGIFLQTPRNHIVRKAGCPHCAGTARLTTEIFVDRAVGIHGNVYDYTNVVYTNATTPVRIVCNIHGTFAQKPTLHLSGCGCPKCNYSKGERLIEQFLIDHHVNFIAQYSPIDLTNASKKAHYRFDFFLPDHNILIEFDGIQHDKPVSRWNSKYTSYNRILARDNVKNEYAASHNITMVRIKYKNMSSIPTILTTMLCTN